MHQWSLNHIKDIHEVQDIQPRQFNYICYRGVAARARSVHLMHSNARKLQHHPVMPILNENLTDHRKPAGSPQTLPLHSTASTASKHTQ